MIAPNPDIARTLENRASEIAAQASRHFTTSQAGADGNSEAARAWENHFRQRVLELSAAVAAGEPTLFSSRVRWSQQALSARSQESVPLGASLQSLRDVILEALPAGSASEALACIEEAMAQIDAAPARPETSQLDPGIPTQRLALMYLQAALEGNTHQAIETVMDAIDDGLDPRDAITRVLLAAQREIGHLWHLDQVTVAEEHLVTTTTQRLMALIAYRAPRAPDRGRTAVAATIAGNAHEVGIRAIAYLLEMDGWRAIYLGSDVPRSDLPAAIHFFDADIALLSMALSSQLSSLRTAIEAIREICDKDIRIMVGGNGFMDAPEMWKTVGADGFAVDAAQALQLAQDLVDPSVHH